MTTTVERTAIVTEYYTKMVEELIMDVDILDNSKPLSKMSCALMDMNKEAALKRIDDLMGFLEMIHDKVSKIDTTLLR